MESVRRHTAAFLVILAVTLTLSTACLGVSIICFICKYDSSEDTWINTEEKAKDEDALSRVALIHERDRVKAEQKAAEKLKVKMRQFV